MLNFFFISILGLSSGLAFGAPAAPEGEGREVATDKSYSPAYLEKIDQSRPQGELGSDFFSNSTDSLPERAQNEREFQKSKKNR